MGITFQRDAANGLSVQVFVEDVVHAGKAMYRRSVSRGLVICGCGCVSWLLRTQKCVTLSTMEAEYVVMADILKEVLFLRQVWRYVTGSKYAMYSSTRG